MLCEEFVCLLHILGIGLGWCPHCHARQLCQYVIALPCINPSEVMILVFFHRNKSRLVVVVRMEENI